MRQIDRPDPNGWRKPLEMLARFAGVAYLLWTVNRFFSLDGALALTPGNLFFAILMIVGIGISLYRVSRPDLYRVAVGTHEVLVASPSGDNLIPLGEATVRLEVEDPTQRNAMRKEMREPRTRQLFIDHAGGSTKVHIGGMLPAHVEMYAADLTAAFAKARFTLGLPDPQTNEFDA